MSQEFAEKLNKIEGRWQEKWDKERIYEPEPDEREKFFITVAYPYPSGGMHVGHVRTYTLPDVFARFKRMQGFNVLFPMGWHVTGTPIIGALERLQEGEEEQLDVLKNVYNVPEETLESFEKPMDYADYFIEESYKKNMKKLGFSVDWRREFTTDDEKYQKFIEWQYKRLKDQGLLETGLHPTKYDLKSENPVTTHDLLEGENAERQEFTLVKFETDSRVFPCATLRPETVYGVTHIMVDPEQEYVIAEVDGSQWVVTEEAATKLLHQDHEVDILDQTKGSRFIGQKVTNPVTGQEVPVLPADFIDPDAGTGVVMSVPAHAPYDYMALRQVQENADEFEEYGLDPEDVKNIEPVKIIETEGYGDNPAKEAAEEHDADSTDDEEALEAATDDVYEKEFHEGTLNSRCQDFAGKEVQKAKDQIKQQFVSMDRFDTLYDFTEEVRSRSGGKVIVSLQESWFLDYSDKAWSDKVHKLIDDMNVIPETTRQDYRHTVDWLEEWPCIRNYGLGTPMPFDDDFIVEPLSDSTIYMAFYTISHMLEDVEAEQMEPELFDYLFQDKHTASEVSEKTGIDQERLEGMKESFDYWYPLDWRTSAEDLIQNHLTFMMYHHTALFNEDDWPRGVATWGMGLLEGEKMSSSKGHVVTAEKAIEKYGGDTTRFFLFASVEPWQDFDWRADQLQNYRNKLEKFYNRTLELNGSGESREKTNLDRYVLSKTQKIKRNATEALEDFQTRKAGLNAFFEFNSLINDYRKRAETLNEEVVREVLETQVRLMAPFTPHLCEELWSELGHNRMVAVENWPRPDEDLIDEEVEERFSFLQDVEEDIREVSEMVDEFDQIRLVLASDWKRDLFGELETVVDERPEFGEAMSRLVEGRQEEADFVKQVLQDYLNEPDELPVQMTESQERKVIEENISYIEQEFDAQVTVEGEEESESEKAGRARPGKPAIILE